MLVLWIELKLSVLELANHRVRLLHWCWAFMLHLDCPIWEMVEVLALQLRLVLWGVGCQRIDLGIAWTARYGKCTCRMALLQNFPQSELCRRTFSVAKVLGLSNLYLPMGIPLMSVAN